ncbi:hypothetical protein E2C01_046399 [Portunus trituberculatus]|uniref:Uncharacterized protein n=1 Tax=Portunus trituberculatus TaxID=210409 RepID=A0A5B7G5W9_PORTR|nr:hypothetical protein [Portunus trituberculatus]
MKLFSTAPRKDTSRVECAIITFYFHPSTSLSFYPPLPFFTHEPPTSHPRTTINTFIQPLLFSHVP